MHQFGLLSERGGNSLNLLQKEGVHRKVGDSLRKEGVSILEETMYDPNQNRSTTGFQTFDTGQFPLSLQRTIKKSTKH